MTQLLEPMGPIRRFTHNVLDWHNHDGQIGFDGCSLVSRCRYCGKVILQDSQGNWFVRNDQPEPQKEHT